MRKIKVKYKVFTGDYFTPYKYKQATFPVEVPTNEYGFILIDTLGKMLAQKIKEKESLSFEVLKYQV